MRVLIITIVLLLVGCVTHEIDAQGYKWECVSSAIEPIRVYEGVDVYLNCGFEEHALSCSVRRSTGCDIYLPDNAAPWMEPHERRHCSGCRHPNSMRVQ